MLLCQNEAFVETSHFSHALNSILSPSDRKFPFFKSPLPTDCLFLYWNSSEMEREKRLASGGSCPIHTCSFPLPWEDSTSSHWGNILGRANGRRREHPGMELVNPPKARQLQLRSC